MTLTNFLQGRWYFPGVVLVVPHSADRAVFCGNGRSKPVSHRALTSLGAVNGKAASFIVGRWEGRKENSILNCFPLVQFAFLREWKDE